MKSSNQSSNDKLFIKRALEATIQIGLVVLLLYWCFKIGQPFLQTIVWGIIIAVAIHPGYDRLKSALGGRGRLVGNPDNTPCTDRPARSDLYAFPIPHRNCTGVFGTA